jgi:hypothetical protein
MPIESVQSRSAKPCGMKSCYSVVRGNGVLLGTIPEGIPGAAGRIPSALASVEPGRSGAGPTARGVGSAIKAALPGPEELGLLVRLVAPPEVPG